MQLDALVIGDAVSAPPDGKFYVHGGGFTRFEVPGLPAQIGLGVLVRLKVEDADLGTEPVVQIALIGPAGIPNIPPVELHMTPIEDPPPGEVVEGEERFAQLALQLQGMAVRDGLYKLEVEVDGSLVKSVPLPLVVVGPGLSTNVEREWVPGPNPPAPGRKKPQDRPKARKSKAKARRRRS